MDAHHEHDFIGTEHHPWRDAVCHHIASLHDRKSGAHGAKWSLMLMTSGSAWSKQQRLAVLEHYLKSQTFSWGLMQERASSPPSVHPLHQVMLVPTCCR
jgi:hypothetical protein